VGGVVGLEWADLGRMGHAWPRALAVAKGKSAARWLVPPTACPVAPAFSVAPEQGPCAAGIWYLACLQHALRTAACQRGLSGLRALPQVGEGLGGCACGLRCRYGQTAVHIAARRGSFELVHCLVEAGGGAAVAAVEDCNGMTAADVARRNGNATGIRAGTAGAQLLAMCRLGPANPWLPVHFCPAEACGNGLPGRAFAALAQLRWWGCGDACA
jgi:hypothetical protein